MDTSKHIWEGWTVQDFINELGWEINLIMTGNTINSPFRSKKELKEYCMNNQPYYKKHIPEVVTFFSKKYNIK